MLPSSGGRPRAGITSTAVYADSAAARRMITQLLEHSRPGTMAMPLTLESVPAAGPSTTLSGIAGYRIVSRGARTTATAGAQVAELNAVAEQLMNRSSRDLRSA